MTPGDPHPAETSLRSAELIQALPAAIYTCDPEGYIRSFNAAAADLWGRAPDIGKDRWCGSRSMLLPDGTPLEREECPMAMALRGGKPAAGMEIVIERKDGTRRHVIPYPELIRDSGGRVSGAVNMLVDITARREAELERELASRLPFENPSPVLRLDGAGLVTFSNPAADELLAGLQVGSGLEAPGDLADVARTALETGGKRTVEWHLAGRTYHISVVPLVQAGYINLYFTDISGLKRAEAALRATEQRFRTVAVNSPVAIFTKDTEGRYTLANPIACEALGHPNGVEGKTDHEMLSRELADILRAHDLQVMRDGIPVQREESVGNRRFLASKFPLPGEDGTPVGVCGVSVDITERSRIEALLRESEERFRTLANHAPVGIFLSSADGDAVFVNQSWCRMTGMSLEEAFGRGWTKALHPEDRDRVLNGWSEAVRDHASSLSEFRFLRPDGSVCWVQGNALRLLDPAGGHTGYIGSCVDITERRKSAEELALITAESQRKRRLYEGLLSATPDLAYVFNLQRRFTYANEALLETWGKSAEESIGKTCLELGYEPWHAEMHDREIDEVIATKRPVRGEAPFHGTGGRRIYEYILTPVIGADGEVEAIAGTTRDVTERKIVEDRAQFLSELSGALAPLTLEKEIIAAAVESVGKRLGSHRCNFVECHPEENRISVKEGWVRDGAPDIAGTYPLHDFGGDEWWRQYSAGNFAVADATVHPLTRDRAETYRRLGVLSYAVQPFKAEGRSTVVLAVTDSRHRVWNAEELTLVEHVIARVWPLVQRARSEAALRESRRQLRLVSDHVPALISYLDRNEVFRFANGRYQEWFGLKPGELKGKPLREVLDAETYSQRTPYIIRVLQGQTVKFEGPARHRELGWRDMEISYVPDFQSGGQVRGFYVMALDITERKRTEKLLERQARRLRLLWEAAGIILTSEDPDAMLQRVFTKISPMLDVDVFFNFMVNETGDALHLQSCRGITAEQRAGLERLEFGQAACGTAAPRRRAMECGIQDSTNPLVQLVKGFGIRAYACNPLMAGDEFLGTLSFASTTRDCFEPDELEFMETISHYVTGAYARLRLVGNLRAADQRKDEFLATLAHELRNPLAPIRTGLEVMKMAGGRPEAVERVRATMERQVEQLVMLVNDLLDVSRITRGKLQLRTVRAELGSIVRSAVEASAPIMEESGHYFEVRLPAQPVHLEADPHRLAQVISNLLNNAAKYTGRGGRISLEVTTQNGEVVVQVKDDGIGIPPTMLDRIFEMFTQIDSGSGSAYGGLGIGLTLVKSLVEMHGGSIRAESGGPGQGSAFSFRLPVLAQDGACAAADATPGSALPVPRRRVLVVDDNEAAATTLAMLLEHLGHEARVAGNGRDGLELAAAFLPDAIFMDLGMPVMDGWEAARALRGEEWGRKIVLVALTGWGQEEDRRKTRDAGFDHHLVKPAHPSAIREIFTTIPRT